MHAQVSVFINIYGSPDTIDQLRWGAELQYLILQPTVGDGVLTPHSWQFLYLLTHQALSHHLMLR